MGLWDKLKGELIDIIEWLDQTNDTLVYRFERYGNEIKNGAKLIVRESQVAVFVNEGEIADVFSPGTYTLETKNLPILATLKGWKYGFNSPFKAEVYFVSTKLIREQKWGTPNPFGLPDAEFGRVMVRAFGTVTYRIIDAAKFIREVSGTDGEFTTEEIIGELRSLIVTHVPKAIAQSGKSYTEMNMNLAEISKICEEKIRKEFVDYGLEVTKFKVNQISLPKDLQEKYNLGAGMNMIGNMNTYQQMQMADAMKAAANNPGGGGGMEGMFGMAIMSQMLNQGGFNQQNRQPAPPPPPPVTQFYALINGQQQGPLNIQQLSSMAQQGLLQPNTMVWKQGMPNWAAANSIPELAGIFTPTAPPPPPPPPMQ